MPPCVPCWLKTTSIFWDLSQTILRGAFTMVMAVDVGGSSASIGELRTMLEDLGGKMGISIRIQREEIFDAMHRI